MNKLISIVGAGFVGGSLATVMAEKGFCVNSYDKAGVCAHGANKLTSLENLVNAAECNPPENVTVTDNPMYFICLPTPMKEDGSADLSIVESTLEHLSMIQRSRNTIERIAVIKSTVPPGSVENWNKKFNDKKLFIVFNPEFLREATALDDMRTQDRIILGGPKKYSNIVKNIFQAAFPNVTVIKTSSTNAEMTKYVANTFLATKVSFANEIYQICEALRDKSGFDVDYDRIIECATLDKRLGTSHWKVPGPMPSDDTGELVKGFAGSCFIKDLNALIFVAKTLGIDPKVMTATWHKNLEVRPQKDWLKLVGRAVTDHSQNKQSCDGKRFVNLQKL